MLKSPPDLISEGLMLKIFDNKKGTSCTQWTLNTVKCC